MTLSRWCAAACPLRPCSAPDAAAGEAVLSQLGSVEHFAGEAHGGALNGLNELEWVPVGGAGEVWANLYPMREHKLSECIVRLDPSTGEALGWIDMRGLLAAQRDFVRSGSSHYVLNGIAYDAASGQLLVTGTPVGAWFASPV